jgi:hypothetical protein
MRVIFFFVTDVASALFYFIWKYVLDGCVGSSESCYIIFPDHKLSLLNPLFVKNKESIIPPKTCCHA